MTAVIDGVPINHLITTKRLNDKKIAAMQDNGSDVVGAVLKNKNGGYSIAVDGRVRNMSELEFRKLMLYPD